MMSVSLDDALSLRARGELVRARQQVSMSADLLSRLAASLTGACGVPCTYLPNLYYLDGPVERQRAPWKGPDLHIGIFGAIRPLKNLMTGVWASIQIGRD